jgi:putative hydrolase of the HAD superfamily
MNLGVVFDLDDTLYLERDYVRSGFQAVATFAAKGNSEEEGLFSGFLWDTFEGGVKGRNFDLLIESFDLSDRLSVSELVSVYRMHHPTIGLLPGAHALISDLRLRGAPVGLISDGPVVSQSEKVQALSIGPLLDPIILTDDWGVDYRKPHERAFVEMELCLGHERPLVYIADNPAKDFVAPNRRGWRTIRVRLEGQLHRDIEPAEPAAAPEFDLGGFGEVRSALEALG